MGSGNIAVNPPFASVITIVALFMIYVNGHDFNLHSRQALSKFIPLQSDITTAISASVVLYRLFASMWSAAMLWRCIFILMGNGGISLEQIDRLLAWQIHVHPLRLGLLVSIILLAAIPSQFSGPILTGSITWSSSYRLSEGWQRVTGIDAGDMVRGSYFPAHGFQQAFAQASGLGGTAWKDALGDKRTMRRVIYSMAHLPINSTLKNITLPYFAISKLEWTTESAIPKEDSLKIRNSSNNNPLFIYPFTGVFTLIPDAWGFPYLSPTSPEIVQETWLVSGVAPSTDGWAVGRITYVAGAAKCRDCRVSAPFTAQNDTVLTVLPSTAARAAIALMPMVWGMMAAQNNSLPGIDNIDDYVRALLIRSYAASRTYATWAFSQSDGRLSTVAHTAIQTSRATVLLWRVWLWLSLNFLFTTSGLLFLIVQGMSGQRLVGSPPLAALLLGTSELLHKRDRAFCDFSTMTGDDKGIGYLHFTRDVTQGSHRQVEIVEK